jgi:hypothetical protein
VTAAGQSPRGGFLPSVGEKNFVPVRCFFATAPVRWHLISRIATPKKAFLRFFPACFYWTPLTDTPLLLITPPNALSQPSADTFRQLDFLQYFSYNILVKSINLQDDQEPIALRTGTSIIPPASLSSLRNLLNNAVFYIEH